MCRIFEVILSVSAVADWVTLLGVIFMVIINPASSPEAAIAVNGSTFDAPSAEATLKALATRAQELNANIVQFEFDRLIHTVKQWLTIEDFGGIGEGSYIASACAAAGIKNNSKYHYLDAVELVEGGTPLALMPKKTPSQQKARKDRLNRLVRHAQLYQALDVLREQLPSHSEPEAIARWIEENGRINGVISMAKPINDNEGNADEGPDSNLPALERALIGEAALEFEAPDDLLAFDPVAAAFQRFGDKVRLVPLHNVSRDLLERLSRFAPGTEQNLARDLNFYGRLFQLSNVFSVAESPEAMRPMDGAAGVGKKLPSFPMVFWDGNRFSIAPSRRPASIVVTGKFDGELGLPRVGRDSPLHISTRSWKAAQEELVPIEQRAAYQPEKVSKRGETTKASTVTTVDNEATSIDFKGAGKVLKLKLLPLSKFGSSSVTRQFTVRVSSKYDPKAEATLPPDIVADLVKFIGRVKPKPRQEFSAAISKGELALQIGEAAPMHTGKAVSAKGSATIRVRYEDFGKAFAALHSLASPDGMTLRTDAKGLLELSTSTDGATYSVFIPWVTGGAEESIRDAALLETVERRSH